LHHFRTTEGILEHLFKRNSNNIQVLRNFTAYSMLKIQKHAIQACKASSNDNTGVSMICLPSTLTMYLLFLLTMHGVGALTCTNHLHKAIYLQKQCNKLRDTSKYYFAYYCKLWRGQSPGGCCLSEALSGEYYRVAKKRKRPKKFISLSPGHDIRGRKVFQQMTSMALRIE